MDYREEINAIKANIIEKIRTLVIAHGFNDATYNKYDNVISLCDGGEKYDGYYIRGFIPSGCVCSERRCIIGIFLFKFKDSETYGVKFQCSNMEDDLFASQLYIEDLADLYSFISQLVEHKTDFDNCHKWYSQSETQEKLTY